MDTIRSIDTRLVLLRSADTSERLKIIGRRPRDGYDARQAREAAIEMWRGVPYSPVPDVFAANAVDWVVVATVWNVFV